MASRHKPVVPDELLDRLLGGSDALEAFQSGDLVQDLKKALAERILNAELDQHLDDEDEQFSGNHRNGHSRKRVLTDDGRMELSIPRDRQGRFDPKLVEKHCRRLPGFDDKVISNVCPRHVGPRDPGSPTAHTPSSSWTAPAGTPPPNWSSPTTSRRCSCRPDRRS